MASDFAGETFQNRRRINNRPRLEYDFRLPDSLIDGAGFPRPRDVGSLPCDNVPTRSACPKSTAPLCVRSESLARLEADSTSNSTSVDHRNRDNSSHPVGSTPATNIHRLSQTRARTHFLFQHGAPHHIWTAGNHVFLRRVNNPELRCKQAYYTSSSRETRVPDRLSKTGAST